MDILIIEKEAAVVDFLRQGLEADRHKVQVASDAGAGIGKVIKEPCKLVILNMVPPLEAGLAVVTAFRSASITTPILTLTANNSVDHIVGLNPTFVQPSAK